MSESKHTPGPWEVFGGYRPGIDTADETFSIVVAGSDDLDDESGIRGRTDEEAAANARLIAAAPELLGALEAVKQQCLFDDDDGAIGVSEDVVIPSDLFNRICAAIAKATGGVND